MSGSLRTLTLFFVFTVLLNAFRNYYPIPEENLSHGKAYSFRSLYRNPLNEEQIDKRAMMRLGKRAMMRLGKRAMMRLG